MQWLQQGPPDRRRLLTKPHALAMPSVLAQIRSKEVQVIRFDLILLILVVSLAYYFAKN